MNAINPDKAQSVAPVPVESVYQKRKPPDNMEEENVQFLFHLISPALYHSHKFRSDKEYFRSIAGKEYILPDNSIRIFSVSTLSRYLRNYNLYGMDGLKRKQRADKGMSRSLTPAAEKKIGEILEKVPTATSTSVLARLKSDHIVRNGECSVDSVRRFIDNHELRKVPLESPKLRNSFLVPHAGDLFVADTLYYEKLETPVKGKKQPWLFVQGIIDDHSRVLMVTETYTEDTALNFQFTLRKAISLYGIPERLYVDLGSPYNNHDLTVICNRLGIDLIHAPPRDGAAKGVVENKWKLLLAETRVDIVLDKLITQEELDARVQEWRVTYNSRVNSGVDGIPNERLNASEAEKPLRRIGSQEELSEAFSHERVRVMDNLGIIHLETVHYKAPDELRHLVRPRTKLTVVYDPKDITGTIHVCFRNKKYPLTVDDPMENGRENARNALKRAREAKSCAGMTAAEIKAEERYRARMAGTDRVQEDDAVNAGAEDRNVSEAPVNRMDSECVNCPETAIETDISDASNMDPIAALFAEEAQPVIPIVY